MSQLLDTLRKWSDKQEHYYIKRSSIVEKIEFGNRIFYSKFERVDRALDADLLSRHQAGDITLAVPVSRDNHSNFIFFIYNGDEPGRFDHLFYHLMSIRGINTYNVYGGKNPHKRIACFKLPRQTISSLHLFAKDISDILEKNISKNWKIIPDPALPEAYNIVTIPSINAMQTISSSNT